MTEKIPDSAFKPLVVCNGCGAVLLAKCGNEYLRAPFAATVFHRRDCGSFQTPEGGHVELREWAVICSAACYRKLDASWGPLIGSRQPTRPIEVDGVVVGAVAWDARGVPETPSLERTRERKIG